MKKLFAQGFLSTILPILIIVFSPSTIFSQGKNQIAVKDQKGTGIEGVSVHVFESKTGKCICFMGGCIPSPFDQDKTDKHGNATFKGGKNRPDLKANTTYVASIDDKCQQARQCNNPQQDCSFSATWYQFTTDKNGKFEGLVIKQ